MQSISSTLSRAKPVVTKLELSNSCLYAFTPFKVFVVFSSLLMLLVVANFLSVVRRTAYGEIGGVSVHRPARQSFQHFYTKISHNVHFDNISNYFFCFFEKSYFSFGPHFLGVLEVRYIHEKSMQLRFFVFCSCLPKKLSGDVLPPSNASFDPPALCTCP